MRLKAIALLLATSAPLAAVAQAAQAPPLPSLLVTWAAPGALALPTAPEWHFQSLTMNDNGNRPVVLYENPQTKVFASFILFKISLASPPGRPAARTSCSPSSSTLPQGYRSRKMLQ